MAELYQKKKVVTLKCSICKVVRFARADVKRKTDLCPKCSLRKVRMEQGDILHGLSEHPVYRRWKALKRRCVDPAKRRSYLDKGITVCDEWTESFLRFFEWSLRNGFSPELELDRIDNDGNYCPENCRWVTHKENMQNRGSKPKHFQEIDSEPPLQGGIDVNHQEVPLL